MDNRRSSWQDLLYGIVSSLMTISLTLALLPSIEARATEEQKWTDTIDEMVASGNYVEGEAVIALRGNEDLALSALSALPVDTLEPLMEVGPEAAGTASEGLVAQASQDITLTLASSDSLSTEEILRACADDPRVVLAEPNYLYELMDEEPDDENQDSVGEPEPAEGQDFPEEPAEDSEASNEAEPVEVQDASDSPAEEQAPDLEMTDTADRPDEATEAGEAAELALVAQGSGAINDLRPLQWGNWDTTETGAKAPVAAGNYSINVPAFATPEVGANMDNEVVVAVIDGPVDFTNPDLEDRAYTFSPELQEQLGCDVHGFNASAVSTDGKIHHHLDSSLDSHGTHCAGIIGATWDGHGTSGVASNVKIVSIQLADSLNENESRKTSLANGLRAFDFVKRANEAGVGIKVTSNSWSFYQTSKALNAATYELGKTQGVVTVIAASNESFNSDYYPVIASTYVDNPYVIIVAAQDESDKLASLSNYGERTVDLSAPGVSILSTDTEARGLYIPGTTDSDILFEDFETDAPIATVQQIDGDGNYVGEPAAVCTDTHLMGKQAVKVPVDPEAFVSGGGWFTVDYLVVRVDFDLNAAQEQSGIDVVNSLRAADELLLGLGLTAPQEYDSTALYSLQSNLTGDAELPSTATSVSTYGSLTTLCTSLDSAEAPRNVDNLNGHLVIDLYFTIDDDCTAIYLDSLGVGSQRIPYSYKSGTSMACPTISGAAAVLSSQSGLEGAELASLVRSKVRIPEAGTLPVRTGGVFDFTVEGSVDSGGEEAFGPSIAALEVSGTTVTLTGSNFGRKRGAVALSRIIVGKDETPVGASVSSWSDEEVTLSLDAPFTGIIKAVLTNSADGQDTRTQFVSKGETVFEQDLPLDTSTGDPFLMDNMGDLETRGPLVGLGCKLYYLPNTQPTELVPSHQRMFCFDLKTQTWSELPRLPEPLQGISAVMYEGTIVVEGATLQLLPSGEPTSEFPDGQEAQERVYRYDPTTSSWSQESAEGLSVGQSIVNNDGQLMMVGGIDTSEGPYGDALPASYYDLSTGLGDKYCDMVSFFINPQAVAKDGVIYLYEARNLLFMEIRDASAKVHLDWLPEMTLYEDSEPMGMQTRDDPFIRWGVLAVASDGIVLVGLPSADGSSETYILRDGTEKFVPYEKRASEDRVYNPAACTYRGRLFVIGSAWFEPDQRLFRATAMDVPEYPGDIPCDVDPEPTPEPTPSPTPTPTPEPKPTPKPTPSPKPSSRTPLPKTDDPSVPKPVLIAVAAGGLIALIAGIGMRIRSKKPHSK